MVERQEWGELNKRKQKENKKDFRCIFTVRYSSVALVHRVHVRWSTAEYTLYLDRLEGKRLGLVDKHLAHNMQSRVKGNEEESRVPGVRLVPWCYRNSLVRYTNRQGVPVCIQGCCKVYAPFMFKEQDISTPINTPMNVMVKYHCITLTEK